MKELSRMELFDEVKKWLEAGKITFTADGEQCFRFRVNGDHGLLDVRLICEDEPLLLQAFCPMPIRIPADKVSETGLLLQNINAHLRMGSFQLRVEERVVEFRLTMPIRTEAPLAEQFGQTVGTTLTTTDEYVRPLALQACEMREVRQQLAKLLPVMRESPAHLPNDRLELN